MTCLIDGHSLETTAKDVQGFDQAKALLAPGTDISVTFLPAEDRAARVAMARAIRKAGFTPIPHISARRIGTQAELEAFLDDLASEATVSAAFVVAGDLHSRGAFPDALAVINSGSLSRYGIGRVGIAGYPEGHPDIPQPALWEALKRKAESLLERGHSYEIVTQFSFDSDAILNWLQRLREERITAPVKIGIPGPASVRSLLKFAARCGVGVSTRVLAKYGLSVAQILHQAGPDALICDLGSKLHPDVHGAVKIHLYPFGGLLKTAQWAQRFRLSQRADQHR